jgi:hypothetical protein
MAARNGANGKTRPAEFRVYVIKLDPEVYEADPKFRRENPDWDRRKPCIYVGSSVHEPEVRFRQHREGYNSGRNVEHFGRSLRPRLYQNLPSFATREEVKAAEKKRALQLQRRGFAVWSK